MPEQENKLTTGGAHPRLKLARAGVFFPMPETKSSRRAGLRHRAALGITEETDAVVVVVSEERGTISFCFSGNIVSNLDGQSLRHALLALFGRSTRKKRFARKVASASPGGARPTIPVTTPRPSMAMPPPAPPPPAAAATLHSGRVLTDAVRPATATPLPGTRSPLAPAKRALSEPMRPAAAARCPRTLPKPESPRPGGGQFDHDPAPDPAERLSTERGRHAVEPPEPTATGSERTPTPRTTFVPTPSGVAAEAKGAAGVTPVPGDKT